MRFNKVKHTAGGDVLAKVQALCDIPLCLQYVIDGGGATPLPIGPERTQFTDSGVTGQSPGSKRTLTYRPELVGGRKSSTGYLA